jgi:hypothetical protein
MMALGSRKRGSRGKEGKNMGGGVQQRDLMSVDRGGSGRVATNVMGNTKLSLP